MSNSNLVTIPKFAEMKGVTFSTVYRRLKIMVDSEDPEVQIENPVGDIEVELLNGVWYIDLVKNKKVSFRKYKSRKRIN